MRRRIHLLLCAAAASGCHFEGAAGADGELGPADVTETLESCLAYRDAGFVGSGVYPLAARPSDYSAYCDMEARDGGWTLVLKIDGDRTTFLYDAEQPGALGGIWTSPFSYNSSSSDLDSTEAKLRSFSALELSEILIRFDASGSPGEVVVGTGASMSSMQALFTGPTTPALATLAGDWRALVDAEAVVLQPNCDRLAVNQENSDFHRNRLGLDTNNEDDCDSNDSGVGLGFSSTELVSPAAGAQNALDRTKMPVFASVFVR